MKSKEAIRNTILNYTNQIWGTRKIERLDLLIQMMVSTLTNELYLMQNKLADLDSTLLEKIAKKLTPEKYMAIRPAHTMLYMRPKDPVVSLEKNYGFNLEWIPENFFIEKNEGIIFHPVVDTYLFNLSIDHFFYYKQLFTINSTLEKTILLQASAQPEGNAIWLGLDIHPDIENLENLAFYIDFKNYSEIDELYEVLPYTKCYIADKEISLKKGLPKELNSNIKEIDNDILNLYDDHYLRIGEPLYTKTLTTQSVPDEILPLLNPEKVVSLPEKYWLKLVFPAYFTISHLDDISITVNAFPVSNKRLTTKTIIRDNLSSMNILPSMPGEKLLTIESITDNKGQAFHLNRHKEDNEPGTYQLDTINKIFIEEHSLTDCLEQLQDIIEDERAVFSGINKELIEETLMMLNKEHKGDGKIDINDRMKGGVVDKISIIPYEDTLIAKVDYWVSYGDQLGNVPAGKIFNADKGSRFDGLTALSLCEVHGAKEFTDIQDIMSIDRYIFTSKDRIITEHNIRTFCESELGRAITSVEIKLDGKISPKPKEGIIRVIKIILIPSDGYPDLLYKKGVLKSLKTRLAQRSPSDFIYEIIVKENIRVNNE